MSENTTPITAAQALELFTGKDHPRAWVNSPVLDGEHVYATNGHWLIRVGSALVDLPQPGGRETAQPDLQKTFAAHWRDLRDNAVPLSALALPDPEPCSQCSGSGKWRATTAPLPAPADDPAAQAIVIHVHVHLTPAGVPA